MIASSPTAFDARRLLARRPYPSHSLVGAELVVEASESGKSRRAESCAVHPAGVGEDSYADWLKHHSVSAR